MRALRFAAVLVLQVWLAHALAFFAHEYGHSFTAWALGWKADPLRLNWGGLSWPNLLAMVEIDERVDYGPIFAAHAGAQASLIAAAGVLANLLLYPIAAFACLRSLPRRPAASLFFYWLAVMCVGNFLDYVPVRTFSPEGDMHTLERGLGAGPWWVLLGLGAPFLLGGLHLLWRLLPRARREATGGGPGRAWAVTVVTTFLLFVFFASAGFETSAGPPGHVMAVASILLLFPLFTFLYRPGPRDAALTPRVR